MEWQSIESAPKDGNPILLLELDNNGYWYIFSGCHSYGAWYCLEYDVNEHNPSYWMPLPPLPNQSAPSPE